MGLISWNRLQIFQILILSVTSTYAKLHILDNILIFFLKHICIDTIHRLSGIIILLILGNLIDKEQRQNFDTLIKQLTFSLNMGKNRLSDLDTAQLVLADLADDISGINLDTVDKFYRIIPSVNSGYHKTLFVFLHMT